MDLPLNYRYSLIVNRLEYDRWGTDFFVIKKSKCVKNIKNMKQTAAINTT